MRRATAATASAVFLVLAPGTVAGVIPWWISRWQMRPPLFGVTAARWLGIGLMAAGLPVLIESVARFAWQGLGTPAPVLPTRHLVVRGFYRWVRNPMYVAVVSIILGQGLWFGDTRLLGYAALVWVAFHLFVLGYEEPALRRTFGTEFAAYCGHVRRWLPRVRPWKGPGTA